ncbi:MAG: SurA N-terminal domain-containing protein [Armatimonadetes bacterium]|nr:SurA N-terminal domain-containing protein [Armatimonadota bacterium]
MNKPTKPDRRKTLFTIGAAMFGALIIVWTTTLAGCGGEDQIASVDNDPISMDEYYQLLATKRTVRAVVQGQVVEVQIAETLGFQALQELATRKIVMHMAADAGLAPTKDEVEAEIKFKSSLNPQYLDTLRGFGYTMGQINSEVAYQLAEERLLTRGIDVEMAEVDRLIEEEPEQFMEPAIVDFYQVLVLSQERKDLVDEELAAAQNFKVVAKRYNQAPEGEHVVLRLDSLTEPLKSALENAPIGRTTDWVATAGGFKRFSVESRTEATMPEMTENRKKLIRRQLALAYGRRANDLSRQVAQKLRSSEVKVSDNKPTLKGQWERFEDRLGKADDTSPPGTPPTG